MFATFAPKFATGRLLATPGAIEAIGPEGAFEVIQRHASGDWGDLDPHDQRANDEAVRYGGRILSAYDVGGRRVWVITEADRSATTVLLPEEY